MADQDRILRLLRRRGENGQQQKGSAVREGHGVFYRGGAAVAEGAGLPSTVFGSINSRRVPSGS